MITPAHTQLIVSALSFAAQAASQTESNRHQLEAQVALFEAKASVLRELIHALVEKRVDAVKDGFNEVLGMYAEQARHFMSQQARYADAELEVTDPLQRADLRKRLSEIDIELRSIRADARRIYTQMTQVMLRLGSGALSVSPEYCNTLALPDLRGSIYG
jgi:hypothetical protein